MFYKVVRQHMQGVVGSLLTTLLQIYRGIFQWENFENRLRFDKTMAMRVWPHFFWPTLYVTVHGALVYHRTDTVVAEYGVSVWNVVA